MNISSNKELSYVVLMDLKQNSFTLSNCKIVNVLHIKYHDFTFTTVNLI